MQHPRRYLKEIQDNLQKMQSQSKVTPAENALFGMVNGLSGLLLTTLERVTDLERRIAAVDGGPGPRENHATQRVTISEPPS